MHRAVHELHLHRHASPEDLGRAAGDQACEILAGILEAHGTARVMLAAAPSQEHTLDALVTSRDLDLSRLEFFHMDDYLGLPADAPQGFGNWLDARVVQRSVHTPRLHRIRTDMEPTAAADDYEMVMGIEPFDLVLLGLGVNAHLAFNDPPADFDTPRSAEVVRLDPVSRRQQVDEGHFATYEDVPGQAVTVTIPRLLHSAHMIASVPGAAKRRAVADTVHRDPDPDVPGTALKFHPDAHLHVDKESGADV